MNRPDYPFPLRETCSWVETLWMKQRKETESKGEGGGWIAKHLMTFLTFQPTFFAWCLLSLPPLPLSSLFLFSHTQSQQLSKSIGHQFNVYIKLCRLPIQSGNWLRMLILIYLALIYQESKLHWFIMISYLEVRRVSLWEAWVFLCMEIQTKSWVYIGWSQGYFQKSWKVLGAVLINWVQSSNQ